MASLVRADGMEKRRARRDCATVTLPVVVVCQRSPCQRFSGVAPAAVAVTSVTVTASANAASARVRGRRKMDRWIMVAPFAVHLTMVDGEVAAVIDPRHGRTVTTRTRDEYTGSGPV